VGKDKFAQITNVVILVEHALRERVGYHPRERMKSVMWKRSRMPVHGYDTDVENAVYEKMGVASVEG